MHCPVELIMYRTLRMAESIICDTQKEVEKRSFGARDGSTEGEIEFHSPHSVTLLRF